MPPDYVGIVSFAGLANLERESFSTFAGDSTLEFVGFGTFASISSLEKIPLATLACFADLVYYRLPPGPITEKKDLRNQSRAHPVARLKETLILPAGDTEISSRIDINCEVKQIVIRVPALEGETVKVQLLDELGAQLYESASQSESGIRTLFSSAPVLPLAGISTLNLVITNALSANATFTVLIYGT